MKACRCFFCSVFLLSTASLLVACSSIPTGENKEVTPIPDGKTPELNGKTVIHQWRLQGLNVFSCSRDQRGYYWRFLNTSGTFTNEKGKKIAELKPNNRIVTLSGTSIDLRSPRLVERHGSKDLPDILFEAQTYSTDASYKDTLYVVRHRSQGGLPLDTCSPGQYQHLLKVNYLATFALWR